MTKNLKKTIPEIICVCGGDGIISKTCELTESAVRKWRSNGINDRYWSLLISLSEKALTENDLFHANEILRQSKAA